MRPSIAGGVSALVLICAMAVAAQAPTPLDAGRVHDLVALIESADQPAALAAADELVRMGPGVAPSLVHSLETDQSCQTQWIASSVLDRLGLEAPLVERTFLRVASGTCLAPTVAQAAFRSRAAFSVIDRVPGIALMAELLRGDDVLAQNRAATAMRELVTRLDPAHPRPIVATRAILQATEAALPPLREVATSRANVDIRCAAYDALDQARSVPHEAVRARATALLAKVRIDCRVTDTIRRQGLEEVIARLDRQPPELAAKTTSALLATPEDVVPLLQKRLRQTDSCRGLALVAGILAGRNAAEADVDAAFSRVLVGRCDGREPFDLQLAQSVASAFVKRPEGLAKVTTLLTDRDVALRRRATEAFAGLFERLGQGEHSQADTLDPALLAPARAALEPLVALATTERDQQARCQAVRALQRAQEAADAGLRDAATAVTTGRTLRCLASPNP